MTIMRIRNALFGLTVAFIVSMNAAAAQTPETEIIDRVDHLVYATADLERGIAEVENLLGVRATIGGRHPGRGTHNALLALGPRVYLEIIAPDPEQPEPSEPRTFGIDQLAGSGLVAWAANGTDLEEVHRNAVRNRIPVGAVAEGSRNRPDGVTLTWRFTDPGVGGTDGVIPFFIDWGQSPHPATTSPAGARLIGFRVEHPDATAIRQQLRHLGLDVRVDPGPRPALIAIIDGPSGRVELR